MRTARYHLNTHSVRMGTLPRSEPAPRTACECTASHQHQLRRVQRASYVAVRRCSQKKASCGASSSPALRGSGRAVQAGVWGGAQCHRDTLQSTSAAGVNADGTMRHAVLRSTVSLDTHCNCRARHHHGQPVALFSLLYEPGRPPLPPSAPSTPSPPQPGSQQKGPPTPPPFSRRTERGGGCGERHCIVYTQKRPKRGERIGY